MGDFNKCAPRLSVISWVFSLAAPRSPHLRVSRSAILALFHGRGADASVARKPVGASLSPAVCTTRAARRSNATLFQFHNACVKLFAESVEPSAANVYTRRISHWPRNGTAASGIAGDSLRSASQLGCVHSIGSAKQRLSPGEAEGTALELALPEHAYGILAVDPFGAETKAAVVIHTALQCRSAI